MTTWFTSDTHLGHAAIIEYCGRPFRDVENMDAELIARWNARVQPGDHVYHLGDFCFGKRERIAYYRQHLNGEIFLVRGNHDRGPQAYVEAGMIPTTFSSLANIDGVHGLWLTHKPALLKMSEAPAFQYNLHGHVHRTYARRGKWINVGVDVRDFEPKTLAELLAA